MAAALTADQEAATKAFVDAVTDFGASAISRATAIKFLLARKFDVARATALWRQHEATRRREGLMLFDPLNDPLRSELATGKFTVLPTRDATGAAIAIFTANRHQPTDSSHQTTLQGVVYQLDVALQSIDTQRAGLVFIYDMTDSKYTNFDYDLSQKILTLLKGGYPAKLKKVLIVTAPLWFKAPFRILRLFVREKLRERVHTVSAPQLVLHVPRHALPQQLGGSTTVDHDAWLLHCLKSFTNGSNGVVSAVDPQIINLDYTYANHCAPPPAKLLAYNGNIGEVRGAVMTSGCNDGHQPGTNGDSHTSPTALVPHNGTGNAPSHYKHTTHINDDDDIDISSNTPQSLSNWGVEEHYGGSASSGFSDEESVSTTAVVAGVVTATEANLAALDSQDATAISGALTPQQLLARVAQLKRLGLIAEYNDIRTSPPTGTFLTARIKQNLSKNRYTDVLCYDHSRVLLSRNSQDPHSDYINANYVDGYKQKNAFISTQGPLPKTYGDFWQMVWEQHALLIVMTTNVMERGRHKCGQYWPISNDPTENAAPVKYGNFMVAVDEVKNFDDYVVTEMTLSNLDTDEDRHVAHWQYQNWPDYGLPCGENSSPSQIGSAAPVLSFLRGVREAQAEAFARLGDTWAGHSRGPPIIVHCSAGIGRTGTFCTLDICISSLEDTGLVDVRGTVERIRAQRAFSIQTPEQYVFCHLAVIEYALMRGLLQSADLTDFDEKKQSN